MQATSDIGGREPFGRVYAEPLAGLRVSWGAILAGAVATVAVSLVLWALAFAIIMTATNATLGSLLRSSIALWICAIATTLVGAFVGGIVAGYLPGNAKKSIAVAHGFLSWAVAFIVSSALIWSGILGVARLVTNTAVTTAAGAIQGTGAAVGGAVGATTPGQGATGGAVGPQGFTPIEQREMSVLVTLGYTPDQARTMLLQQRMSAKKLTSGQTNTANAGAAAVSAAKTAGSGVLSFFEGVGWSWWGTWMASLGLALAGAAVGGRRIRRLAGVEPAPMGGPVGGESAEREASRSTGFNEPLPTT